MPADYSVGFAKPPRQHRFRKGQSGNPRGRPKHTPNVKTALEKLLKTHVTVREGERRRTVSALEAVLLGLLTKALSGHAPSARALLELVTDKFPDVHDATSERLTDDDQAIIDSFLSRHGVTAERPRKKPHRRGKRK